MEENGNLVQFIFNLDREAVTEEDSTGLTRLIRSTELIARSTDAVRTYYHYASDEMGSTTHIVDDEGQVQNRYEYDAWGNITLCEENIPNRFTYYGQQLDPLTQQYYLRTRFYNPVIARFTQEDTYRGDGLNLYAYCANNPIFYTDQSGNTPECVKSAIDDYRSKHPDADDIEAFQALQKNEELARFRKNIESEILRLQGELVQQGTRWKGQNGQFVAKPVREIQSNNRPRVPCANVPQATSDGVKYFKVHYKAITKIDGKLKDISRDVYQRDDIDWNRVDPETNLTNQELAEKGTAPYANDGTKIELHHLTQREPGTMVEIPASIHTKYHKILHGLVGDGQSFRNISELEKQYNNFRAKYWRWRAKNL